ncbi:MAG: glycoside hydrolase TIM-barrel-like domain-containing protein, partial [Pseudomonadota bacterium]
NFDGVKVPIEVASGGSDADGLRVQSAENLVSDQSYEFRIHVRIGTSEAMRVEVFHPDGDVLVTLSGTSQIVITGADKHVLDHSVLEQMDGVVTLRVVLRYASTGNVAVNVGPNSDISGANIQVFGADLSPWPVPPTAWVPRSKPIWFTEFGCPAIDKGSNQPNVFFDPKSSESAVPHYSTGRRDDTIQLQYLRATTQYWSDPENNPTSPLYGGQMIDTERLFAWAWDTRPYPAFPNDLDRWSDGDNFSKGHWISGRISGPSLDLVVAEICRDAGVTDIDVSQLHGVVRGHVTTEIDTARARLQPLMLAYDFSAIERDGVIVFEHLPIVPGAVITEGEAVFDAENEGLNYIRAPQAEMVGRVRLSHVAADGAFETELAEAIFPDDADITISQSELPLSFTRAEARAIAERWLAASRLARDTVKFSLAPSRRDVDAGELIELPGGTLWRVDRMEETGPRLIEATRVEPTISEPPAATEIRVPSEVYVPPTPVEPVFMDLPLLTGDEVEHAPHIAVAASPWPGTVAVYSSASDSNYVLNTQVTAASIIGVLESPLPTAKEGLWDRGAPVLVRISSGNLSSVTPEEVLNGANVAAIGSDDTGPWEVIQFASADLVGPDLWELSMRLRGQVGTEAIIPNAWPVGTRFVLLNGRPAQIDLAASARGLARFYRIGPARRSLDDVNFVARNLAFDGVGLRPYAPTHLRFKTDSSTVDISWVRRTRIDGDSWQGTDVPLGEDTEAYLVRVSDAGGVKREDTVNTSSWSYPTSTRLSDGTASEFTVEVAQLSARFGPGPFKRITINV